MIRKYKFTEDTGVDLKHVSRRNIGLAQYRPWGDKSPPEDAGSSMEAYFPKGTIIEIDDFAHDGTTEEVQ